MLPTPDNLVAAMGCSRALASAWALPLRQACTAYLINTPARLAAYLAQVGHESGSLTRVVENLNYSADGLLRTWPARFTKSLAEQLAHRPEAIANHVYAGRMGNGPEGSGDGWRYRGRSLIQITGKANYEGVQSLLKRRLREVPELLVHPEALENPVWAAYSAAAYWVDHGLNELADVGAFAKITQRINGGQTGAADRLARYQRAKGALA